MPHSIHEILNELHIPFQEFPHEPVFTVEQAKAVYQNIPGGRCKNILLRDKKGNRHFLVIMPADKELDPSKIREKFSTSKLGGAQEYEVEKYLGVKPGAVSPFALINDLERHVEVLVDEDLFKEAEVHFHPNVNTASLLIKTEDLKKFLDGTGAKWQIIAL